MGRDIDEERHTEMSDRHGERRSKRYWREIWEDPQTCEEIWAMTKTWRWGKRHKNRDRTPERDMGRHRATTGDQNQRVWPGGEGERTGRSTGSLTLLRASPPHTHTPSHLG